MNKQGLQSKLIRNFILQICLISLTTLIGVLAAEQVVQKLLVKRALEGEARHFWLNYQKNPSFPKPNTLNLLGYLAVAGDTSKIPKGLKNLTPGYSRVKLGNSQPIVYIEDQGKDRLFLIFDEQQVSDLSFYFGVVPLSLILLLIYAFSWLSYRQTQKAISPIVKLAHQVDGIHFSQQGVENLNLEHWQNTGNIEVATLVRALTQFTERLQAFVERERNFTRDASHELRTPLAVIKSSLALLQKKPGYSLPENKAIDRIARTVNDMESLIETLLLLAKEEAIVIPEQEILVNDVIIQITDNLQYGLNNEKIETAFIENSQLSIRAPDKVLNILFSNLLRNAISHTHEGTVTVTIDERLVTVSDTGHGIEASQLQYIFEPFYRGHSDSKGHGLGLSIVKQLCKRFGWKIRVRSKPGEGTSFSVFFPNGRSLSRQSDRMD